MKKLTLSALLLLATAQAQAALVINGGAGGTAISPFNNYNGEPADYTGVRTSGVWGTISATTSGNIIAYYLGEESGNRNRYRFEAGNALNEGNNIGDQIFSVVAAPGALNFRFFDNSTNPDTPFLNGSTNIAIMSGSGLTLAGQGLVDDGMFDFILGLNDLGGDNDYDDFVVGLKFIPSTSEVPVPAALPLMASALGMFGIARRRKSA